MNVLARKMLAQMLKMYLFNLNKNYKGKVVKELVETAWM